MRGGSVANLIDTLHDGVHGSVVADGHVGAGKVVVDGAWESDDRDVILLGEDAGSCDRTIAADHYKGINAVLLHVLIGELASFRRLEVLGTRRLEDGASA